MLMNYESRVGTGRRVRPPSHPRGKQRQLGPGQVEEARYHYVIVVSFVSALSSNELGAGSPL